MTTNHSNNQYGPSMLTIDCDSCPVRGRMCGDCFVPVLAKVWLSDPVPRRAEETVEAERPAPGPVVPGEPLTSDELAAVGSFVRAGLVDPAEVARLRAEVTRPAGYAAG
ncbi:hypothetical protein [Ornithinimicrobium sp. Y1694]|uniref:hypothetical protein n=1 Tax=Ornithinimicrobium sp. Y1694 TaxID=3418590 RepID=UPI003CF84F0E